MVQPIKEEIALTLVVGAPLVGKTTWCKEQQMLLPDVFIISYDEMLYTMRKSSNLSRIYCNVVANAVYDMIYELSDISKNKHILVDGFPQDFDQLERFVQMTNKISVFHLIASELVVLTR